LLNYSDAPSSHRFCSQFLGIYCLLSQPSKELFIDSRILVQIGG
jgi:hypothetical protein